MNLSPSGQCLEAPNSGRRGAAQARPAPQTAGVIDSPRHRLPSFGASRHGAGASARSFREPRLPAPALASGRAGASSSSARAPRFAVGGSPNALPPPPGCGVEGSSGPVAAAAAATPPMVLGRATPARGGRGGSTARGGWGLGGISLVRWDLPCAKLRLAPCQGAGGAAGSRRRRPAHPGGPSAPPSSLPPTHQPRHVNHKHTGKRNETQPRTWLLHTQGRRKR